MENQIKSGIYKHFKGGYVLVLFTAKHSDREEIEVVYKGLNNGKFYARPLPSFVEIVQNEEGVEIPRFSLCQIDEARDLISSKEIQTLLDAFVK